MDGARVALALWAAMGLGGGGRAQVPAFAEPAFEIKRISAGSNAPTLGLLEGELDRLCLLLHEGHPLQAIRARLGWTEERLREQLGLLQTEGLVKKDGKGHVRPTFLVLTRAEADAWMRVDEGLVTKACGLIQARIPELEARWRTLPAMRNIPFQEGSLYLLSDVLLDDLQINQVEHDFVKAPRPLRNGKSYYYALMEAQRGTGIEAFGIYGNSITRYGAVALGLYGNRRQGENLNTLSTQSLLTLFGATGKSPTEWRGALVLELLQYAKRSGDPLPARHLEGFERLGLIRNGRCRVPVLGPGDLTQLSELSGLVTKDLIRALESVRNTLGDTYQRSPFAEEITFEEYLIWWYHFFYTRITDRLIAQGAITVPANGVFTYLLKVD